MEKTNALQVHSITLLPGRSKSGVREKFAPLVFSPGEIIAIIGATGSGKSQLLEDIECMAHGNTPTARHILINNQNFSVSGKKGKRPRMVAQLSQNMNFIIDLTVHEFLSLHATCWPTANVQRLIERILELANSLTGEKFELNSNVAQLSGGQSRALMIADCALLSSAPIILIDEIENAGINRRKALDLLIGENKIVFLTTHDPLLALFAQKRLVMRNGAIETIVQRTIKEEETLKKLEITDQKILTLQNLMRKGALLEDYE
jgi:ABC-type lipoprotein export system ATPase subunit